MSSKWFWKPVLVGAVFLGVLGCLFIASVLALLSGGVPRYSADSYINDLVMFAPPWIAGGGLIGAGLGALFAVIRKRVRGKGEEASQS
jgi:hypothetical protein